MGIKQEFINYPVKILFTNTLSVGNANDFVTISTGIQNLDTSIANVGFQVKNVANDVDSFFYVKHTNTNHGDNSGFKLGPGESLFVECTSISDIFVKANTNNAISFQVIGN